MALLESEILDGILSLFLYLFVTQRIYSYIFSLFYFHRVFRLWDENSDRKLSYGELAEGLRNFGASLNPVETNRLFTSMDKDGSGSIDYDELLIALRVQNFNTFPLYSH